MARILILQDEASWNGSLCWSLERHHKLTIRARIDSALQILQEENFDLIIARVHLKTENVFDFLRACKSDGAMAPPVICFCGLRGHIAEVVSGSLERVSLTLGATAYLSIEDFCDGDQCNLETLRQAIDSYIEKAVSVQ
jgi:DNA-binding response OmpR family regulator